MIFDSWEKFLDSQFFATLITLSVGLVAFSIYRRQKRDTKRDAANVVLLEIENAEQQLQKIGAARSDDLNRLPSIYLMKEPSWNKHRYLFVKDFDRNEWDRINDFYLKCQTYDEAVSYNESHFDKNVQELRKTAFAHIGIYVNEFVENTLQETGKQKITTAKKILNDKKSIFLQAIGINDTSNAYLYSPQQPLDQATLILLSIETSLSLTSVGQKLKHISFRKNWWQRLLIKLAK